MIDTVTFDIECAGYSVKADWYETDNKDEIILSLIGWTSNRKRYNDILSAICSKTGKLQVHEVSSWQKYGTL